MSRLHSLAFLLSLAAPVIGSSAQTAPEQLAARPAPVTTWGSGPYPALFEADPGLPQHVVYRPRDLATLGKAKLGIYVFGNGGCSADGTGSRNHLLEIASHGYLVIAPGTIPVPRATPDQPQGPPGKLVAATPTSALASAIDWAIRENGRTGSRYRGRIATDQVAASGWSCGGLQAIITAQDKRVKTLVVMNSGVFNDGGNPIAGVAANKAMIGTLHGSALYVLGGPSDIAYANGTDDFRRIGTLPAALVDIPVGHGGTYMQPYGGVGAEVVTAWLDWQLKGRPGAAAKFRGPSCRYCSDSRFTLERKNLD